MSDQPQPPGSDTPGQVPPAGGFPPPSDGPPAGGFPPPGGGAAGGGPPGGPPPSPGGSGGAAGQYTIGEAFNYGWQKFTQNVSTILIGMLIYAVAIGAFYVVWGILMGAIGLVGGDSAAGIVGLALTAAVFGLVAVVGNFVIQTGITRAALALTYGRKPELSTVLATDGLAQVAIGGIVIAVASSIGFFLCYLPGLVVVFFTQFFVHFVLDKRLDWLDAIKASFAFVNANLGTLIGFFIASLVAYMLGAIACGVGIIVALPVVIIAQAYTYRRLHGEPVAA